jgi:histidyl-tRNA synthetase
VYRKRDYDLLFPLRLCCATSSIEFPFRDIKIQPVWRADRPQKGDLEIFNAMQMLLDTSL